MLERVYGKLRPLRIELQHPTNNKYQPDDKLHPLRLKN